MPINITVIGNTGTTEYKDALALKSLFINQIPSNKNGELLIISNATIFGYPVKDIDIIVFGNFEKTKNPIINDVFINDFCFVIECKNHTAENIRYENNLLKVLYSGRFHDVTTQSEKQKYSLKSYFVDNLKESPYICNFIWLRQMSQEELHILTDGNEANNFLPNKFSIGYLFEKAFKQNIPYPTKLTRKAFSCAKKLKSFDLSGFQEYLELFKKSKSGMSTLTRKKLEMITKKILSDQQYAHIIGAKTLIVSGRAGTGKTIKLLRIACDLALNHGKRCLILTYNHALVGDIKRLFALADIPDKIDTYTVNIMTLHKFYYELLIGFGIVKNDDDPEKDVKHIPDYIENYSNYLSELYEFITQGLIQESDIQNLMKSRHDQVAWDYILIDEGQDWNENEKFILHKVFGPNKLIVADGVDQLIRKKSKCYWEKGDNMKVETHKIYEKISLRQKKNLVTFVNSYAEKFRIKWELEVKEELTGGRVIICTSDYNKNIHQKEFEKCKRDGNLAFDMIFFTAPNNVLKTGKDKYGKPIKEFSLKDKFAGIGIKIWDGVKTDLRAEYSININEHRVLQYDSCRGLEGWSVVCLDLDEFIEYKANTYEPDTDDDTLGLISEEVKEHNYVFLWSLIPLTRAIDTLIITIKNKNSGFAKRLREIYELNKDFVEWID